MTIQFSENASRIICNSKNEAIRMSSDKVKPEHLLLAMMVDVDTRFGKLLNKINANPISIRMRLEDILRDNSKEPLYIDPSTIDLNEHTSGLIRLSVLEARMLKQTMVDTEHIMLALLHDPLHGAARNILEELGINYEDAKRALSEQSSKGITNGLGLTDDEEDEEEDNGMLQGGGAASMRSNGVKSERKKASDSDTPVLDNFGTDLTRAASEGKLDPVVGREREIQRVTEILCRRKKNNPALIGEPGVGKSAIVEGLAQLIVDHKTSPVLFGKRIVSLDMTSVVAGTKYRGQFEERMRALIKELEKSPDVIIFIDEIHTMIGAGSAAGTMDAANILKPALARGTIQCIGATTLDEYRNSIEKDGALERRFQKVMVEQTTPEETLTILNNIKERYEDYHNVNYTDDAIEACVKLTERYVSDRYFPDKAIDALDEVGSRVHLSSANIPPEITNLEKELEEVKQKKQSAVRGQNFELAASYRDREKTIQNELDERRKRWQQGDKSERSNVDAANVADVIATMTGIPVKQISENENTKLRNMASMLKADVVAQDDAIDTVVRAIQRNRVGLHDHNRPIGAFMFLGPTGVGKTYLAKRLAEIMFGSADALVRIDMSEYTESFNSSKLIGAPPGYVGYGEGGQLTEKVRRRPYSIVLLDEIEKANPKIFNLMLQLLDEGRITDGNGRLIDFRHTIIIMTSNAGTRRLKEFQHGVGFNAAGIGSNLDERGKEYARGIIQKSLSKTFPPEFINRLDEIITFDQLSLDAIKKIVEIELRPLQKRIMEQGYALQLTDKAKDFVATKGYDIQFGARPLKRALQTYVEDVVCEKILEGDLTQGQTILLDVDGDKLSASAQQSE